MKQANKQALSLEGWLWVMSIFIFPCVFCVHSSNTETFYKERADIVIFNCNKKYYNAKPVLVYVPFGLAIDTEVFLNTQNVFVENSDHSRQQLQDNHGLLMINQSENSAKNYIINNNINNTIASNDGCDITIPSKHALPTVVAAESTHETEANDTYEAQQQQQSEPAPVLKAFSWWDAVFPG